MYIQEIICFRGQHRCRKIYSTSAFRKNNIKCFSTFRTSGTMENHGWRQFAKCFLFKSTEMVLYIRGVFNGHKNKKTQRSVQI